MEYYLSETEQTTGPFSPLQLHERYAAKEISGDTLACPADGSSDWQPLYRFLQHIKPSQATLQQQKALARSQNIQRLKAQPATARPVVAAKPIARPKATPEDIRRENMNFVGRCIIVIGILIAGYFFFFYDTSVHTESRHIYGVGTVGGERVNNIGLMQNRLLSCTAGLVGIVIGTIMVVMNPKKS